MASTAPPVVASHPLVNPTYDLKDLPEVPGARPDRVVLDAFKLGAAKLVAEAWDMDVAKVFAAVDTSESNLPTQHSSNADNQAKREQISRSLFPGSSRRIRRIGERRLSTR
jgi:hypothetical protein